MQAYPIGFAPFYKDFSIFTKASTIKTKGFSQKNIDTSLFLCYDKNSTIIVLLYNTKGFLS